MSLSDEQQAVVKAAVKAQPGEVVIVSGPAGSGKSYIYKHLCEQMPNHAIAAPTGCAANLVGGTTIHKLFGLTGKIYAGESYIQVRARLFKEHWNDKKRVFQLMAMTYPKRVIEFLAHVGCIIVDEYPMVTAPVWDEMDARLRYAKKEPHKAFGGCKMILAGDNGQLPPVVTQADKPKLEALGYKHPFDLTTSRVFRDE
jgi:energy-coupling factor transporter ATP-binding protein EcfA2